MRYLRGMGLDLFSTVEGIFLISKLLHPLVLTTNSNSESMSA